MSVVATVESLWRYPVKSMRGEEMEEIFVSYAGVYGDRLFAFRSSTVRKGLPFLTGRDQREMIRYSPRFRYPEKAGRPFNLEEAAKLSPLVNPVSAGADDLMIDVETPEGRTFAIDDPRLIEHLQQKSDQKPHLILHRSDKAMTDCCPVSIFALQTASQLARESGLSVDKRRFRANIYLDLADGKGFAEDQFVGNALRLGRRVVVQVIARDTRCMMITLNPDTAEKSPPILKAVAQGHESMAGVYGVVLAEGLVRKGDPVELLSEK